MIDPAREERELRAYLGDAYDHERLVHYEHQLDEELDAVGDEESLYRISESYLYNLTAFAMTRTKEPYLDVLRAAVRPGARLLDYGCGIGSDGLALLEAGYEVAFADFDNPSTRYLRWRLDRRGRDARIYDLDREQPPDGFDLAYAFDVIEHVPDPFAFVGRLEAAARMVLVNFLEPEPGETALHHELPVRDLIRHAAARRLLRYERFHGRSHLVLYDRRPGGGLKSRVALARRGILRP
ncbi:MAG: mycofactocin glycosyltransferase [Solirubrobacteraceae bacterium]|nr:mycofactocin glycosyltransferase [Solirubrobacteraceae bacterium]